MKLQTTLPYHPGSDNLSSLESCPSAPAVFAIYLDDISGYEGPPYLGRTSNLRRRLARLLAKPRPSSRLLNLHEQARRIEYSLAGSSFEALWLLYRLNKAFYPQTYRQRLRLKPPVMLKLNIGNRYPRLYPTRRFSRDEALYYGPFPTRVAAERFASKFLDFFKIRRCVEDLVPDPSHPGCIYSQMHMCLAPCFQGCTDEEYKDEVSRVMASLNQAGRAYLRELEEERTLASESLDFERAARAHSKIEKVHDVMRLKPDLVRNLRDLEAVLILPGAEPKTLAFFRIARGELRGPASLSLDENVPRPVSLDEQILALMNSIAPPGAEPAPPAKFPPWEHLSLLARWYYSSFRSGEIVMLEPGRADASPRSIPARVLIRACRKVLAQ